MVGVLVGVPDDGIIRIGEGVGLHPVAPLCVPPALRDDAGDLVGRAQVPLQPLVLLGRKGRHMSRLLV